MADEKHDVRLLPSGEMPPLKLDPGKHHELVVHVEGDEDPQAMTPEAAAAEGGVSLPKLGEKFSVNPVMGAAMGSIGFPAPPARALTPALGLAYDSNGENGPFGLGWALSVPYFQRATTRPHLAKNGRGVPTYDDAAESDVFIFSDAAELLKVGTSGDGVLYRPRLESGFARIERIDKDGASFWRVTDASNVVSLFGASPQARVADPKDPSRVFRWNLQAQVDPLGNVIVYEYVTDQESDRAKGAQSVLVRVLYGNKTVLPDPLAGTPNDFAFELLIDWNATQPTDTEVRDAPGQWHLRRDAFSTGRPGFELRTARLCRGVRVVHRLAGAQPLLVSRTELSYDEGPEASLLTSVEHVGIGPDGPIALPKRTLQYTPAALTASKRNALPASTFEGLDLSIAKTDAEFIDLDGNAMAGLLVRQMGSFAWYRRRGATVYDPPETLAFGASADDSQDPHRQRFFDLDLDGRAALVELGPAATGQAWERNPDDDGFGSGVSLPSAPPAVGDDPEEQERTGFPRVLWGDLDGDGRTDALVQESADAETAWFRFEGLERGWEVQSTASPELDEKAQALFGDPDALLMLLDITGDGLPDLVHLAEGTLTYWPGLGHGVFGERVELPFDATLPTAPGVAGPAVDARRVRAFDVQGTGGVDLLILGDDEAELWINQCGNAFVQGPSFSIPHPDTLALSSLTRLDGRGTASFAFAEAKAGAEFSIVDFVADGLRPRLLVEETNNIGLTSRLSYKSSTAFLPQDANEPQWLTRLPFSIPVVTHIESIDAPAGLRSASTLSYRHGCWDPNEREFRGFGFVEQHDAEDIGVLSGKGKGSERQTHDTEFFSPPVRTRTWFHTGVSLHTGTLSDAYRLEYSDYDPHVAKLPVGESGDPEEVRALKGAVLHSESYVDPRPGADEGETARAPRPFAITEHGYRLEPSAEAAGEHHRSLLLVAEQSLSYSYDRKETPDPRVAHTAVLEVDRHGTALRSVEVAYPRRIAVPEPTIPLTPPPAPDPGDKPDGQGVRARVVGLRFDEAKSFILPEARPGLRGLATIYAEHPQSELIVVGHTDTLGQSADNAALSHARAATVAAFLRDDVETWLDLYEPGTAVSAGGGLQWGAVEDEHMAVALGFATLDAFQLEHGFSGPLDRTQRAVLVQGYMALDGTSLPADVTVHVVGAGEHFPEVPTEDGVDEPANRRVELFFFDTGIEPAVPGAVLASNAPEYAAWVEAMERTLDVSAQTGEITDPTADDPIKLPPEPDPPKGAADSTAPSDDPQLRTEVIRTEAVTILERNDDAYFVGVIAETKRFAVGGQAGDSTAPFSIGALAGMSGGTLVEHSRTHFYDDTVRAAIGHGPSDATPTGAPQGLGRTGLIHSSQSVAFTEAQWSAVFGSDQKARDQLDGTRYLLDEGAYWVPSGTSTHDPGRFFLATASHDPFGNTTTFTYGPDHLFVTEAKDARGNVVKTAYDPRTLSPSEVTDANGVRHVTEYDALGRVTKTFSVGHDKDGTTADTPATEHSYNFESVPISRTTTLRHDNASIGTSKSTTIITYFSGTGAALQSRVKAGGKFRVPGRTQVNNKGLPVKTFEPSFGEQGFSHDAGARVSTIRYDELGRAIRTEYRDGTLERVQFDQWGSIAFDRNDTAVEAGFEGELSAGELAALAHHADTPTRTRLDVLGRPVAVFAELKDEETHDILVTRTHYDEAGRAFEVTDARGNVAEKRRFGLSGVVLESRSVDGGVQASFSDIDGTLAYARRGEIGEGHGFFSSYDELRRPVTDFVQRDDAAVPVAVKHRVWVDSPTDDSEGREKTYHHGRLLRVYDGAGLVHFHEYDYQGNPVSTERVLTKTPQAPDWSALEQAKTLEELDAAAADILEDQTSPASPADPQPRSYAQTTVFDAQGRATQVQNAFGEVYTQSFTEDGLLEKVERIGLDGVTEVPQTIYAVEDYDALGRPTALTRGKAKTSYTYDAKTLRLASLKTKAGNKTLQALSYTYDPMGNIVRIRDGSHKTVTTSGAKVEATSRYRYDSLYRLVEARGREHHGQAGNPGRAHVDTHLLRVSAANDVTAVRNYTQRYRYDGVGNLLEMRHQLGPAHSAAAWTRRYAYSDHGNRLRATAVGNSETPDLYPHDALGRITAMPHLDALEFDAFDQLERIEVGTTVVRLQYADGVRVRKWVEKGGITEERVYAGGVEEFRKFTGKDPFGPLKEHTKTEHAAGGLTIDTKFVKDGSPIPEPKPLFRFRLGNHLGSASVEVDDDGAVISYEEYHPYGTTAYRAVRSDIDVDVNRYRFTGMERDEETGLAQHGARYYASWLGRWCSADPIGLGDGVNRYRYCGGNPVGFTDRGGTKGVDATGSPEEIAGRFTDALRCVEPGSDAHIEIINQLNGLPEGLRREVTDALAAASPLQVDHERLEREALSRENARFQHRASVSPAPENRDFFSRGGGTLAAGGVGTVVGAGILAGPIGWASLAGGLILAGGIALMGVGSAQLVVSYSGNSSARHDDEVSAAALKAQAMSAGPGAVVGAAVGAAVTRSEDGAVTGAAVGGVLEMGVGVASRLRVRPTPRSQLRSSAPSGELPSTGVDEFDRLVYKTRTFERWSENVARRGFTVEARDLGVGIAAEIDMTTKSIVIAPSRFRYIDLLHESRHIAQIERNAASLGRKKSLIVAAFEDGAYRYEIRLGERKGFSSEYMSFLHGRRADYLHPRARKAISHSPTLRALWR